MVGFSGDPWIQIRRKASLPIHLRQKLRPARRLRVFLEPGAAQRYLFHPSGLTQPDAFTVDTRRRVARTFAEFP